MRWNEEKDHAFYRRWKCWQQGRLDQQVEVYLPTKVSTMIIFVIESVDKQ